MNNPGEQSRRAVTVNSHVEQAHTFLQPVGRQVHADSDADRSVLMPVLMPALMSAHASMRIRVHKSMRTCVCVHTVSHVPQIDAGADADAVKHTSNRNEVVMAYVAMAYVVMAYVVMAQIRGWRASPAPREHRGRSAQDGSRARLGCTAGTATLRGRPAAVSGTVGAQSGDGLQPSQQAASEAIGDGETASDNYIGLNYIGHNYIGHNCIGHNYSEAIGDEELASDRHTARRNTSVNGTESRWVGNL